MQISSKTDKGIKRMSNQDALYTEILSENYAFAIVCDGMGGANAGNVASSTATSVISSYIKRSFDRNMDVLGIATMLQNAVKTANIEIFDMAKQNPSLSGMGTTVVALVIKDDTAVVCNAGDSRAYLINNRITQITKDHSVVQTLLESGKLTPQEAKSHPEKNVITKALGVEEDIFCDCFEVYLKQGDNILLCSDGLTNFVETSQIFLTFKNKDISEVAGVLVDLANSNGGGDNVTAVAVSV